MSLQISFLVYGNNVHERQMNLYFTCIGFLDNLLYHCATDLCLQWCPFTRN